MMNGVRKKYFLGIDGGGSGTTVWLAGNQRVLSRVTAGPSNPVKIGVDLAARRILQASRLVLQKAGLRGIVLDAVCAGVAGAGGPAIDRQLLLRLKRGLRARRVILTTDGVIALESALGQSAGVVVISGTGSIAYGRGSDGRMIRCGGWGSVFDDSGSGYDIGREAVAAALRAFDGRGPSTRLSRDICRALKIQTIPDIIEIPLALDAVAALFPVVERAARLGDAVAKLLCDEAGKSLAELALAVGRRIGAPGEDLRIACAGGVFRASSRVRRSFAVHLRQAAPCVRISLLRRPPVEGALAMARAAI